MNHADIKVTDFEYMLNQADEARSDYIRKAERCYKILYHQPFQWKPGDDDELGSGHPESVENHIKPNIRKIASLLLKNDPLARIYPLRPVDEDGVSNFELADEITKHQLSAWRTSLAKYAARKALSESFVTGLSILQVGWDISQLDEYGSGRILVRNVPRIDIWFEPIFDEIGHGFAIERTWHTEDGIRQVLGEKVAKSLLKSYEEKRQVFYIDEKSGGDGQSSGGDSWSSDGQSSLPSYWSRTDDGLYPIYTLWMPPQSPSPMPIDENLEQPSNPYRWGSKSVFFKGKKISTKPNPFAKKRFGRTIGHKTMPYVALKLFEEPDEHGYRGFYDTEGVVEQLEQAQWDLNDLKRILMAIARRAMNPVIFAQEGSIKSMESNLSFTSGRVFWVNRMADMPQPVEAPSVPFVPQVYQETKEYLRDSAGITDWTTGGKPEGTSHTDWRLVALGQEAGAIALWSIIESIDKTILDVTDRMLGLMQQFYKAGRFSAVGMNGETWHREWQERDIKTAFGIRVIPATTTPLRDVETQNLATQIYGLVTSALANPTIEGLMNTKIYLQSLNEPIAYEWIQFITELIDMMKEQPPQQQQVLPQEQGQQATGGGLTEAII